MKPLLVTGSSGLIGSEVVDYFCKLGWGVHSSNNDMRAYSEDVIHELPAN